MSDETPADPFPPEAEVFRGSDMSEPRYLYRNAVSTHAELAEEGRDDVWAISGGCFPGIDIQEVARRSDYDGDWMMVSTVGRLRERGYEVLADRQYPEDVHALIVLPRAPTGETDQMWADLRGAFDGPFMIQREDGEDT